MLAEITLRKKQNDFPIPAKSAYKNPRPKIRSPLRLGEPACVRGESHNLAAKGSAKGGKFGSVAV